MWQSADFFQEFFRQHGHIRSIDAGCLVDVDHIVLSRHHGLGYQLPDSMIQFGSSLS